MGADLEKTAQLLREAYYKGVVPPLRDAMAPTDAEAAYQVQAINVDHWQKKGRKQVGYKIGLTAAAVQKQLGVDQPDFGVLFDDMVITDGGTLDPTLVLQPKAEAEIALILSADVTDPNVDAAGIVASVAAAVAAIEIVDSRIADWKITFADTVADNGSSAFFVLGDDRAPLEGLDLYSCGMVLEQNGEIASLGTGAACLGHPLNAAAWLARTMIARGRALRAGDILMTGALGPMVPVVRGDKLEAKIGGLGSVSFSCGEGCK